jgi:hypothetical protein
MRGVREKDKDGQLSGEIGRTPGIADGAAQRFGECDVKGEIAGVGTGSHGSVQTNLTECAGNRERQEGQEGLSNHSDAPVASI